MLENHKILLLNHYGFDNENQVTVFYLQEEKWSSFEGFIFVDGGFQ